MFGYYSDHSDFAESTEEIKPLTEEEKKAALDALREKAAARKAAQASVDKEEAKKNEVNIPHIASPDEGLPSSSTTLFPVWSQHKCFKRKHTNVRFLRKSV